MPASFVETGIIFYPLMITGNRKWKCKRNNFSNFSTYTIILVL